MFRPDQMVLYIAPFQLLKVCSTTFCSWHELSLVST
uniref:Uncharacterized protein n=1 Tax=Arundo donax TaxID=35708 RepID=A0A0A9AEG1_ARUDO